MFFALIVLPFNLLRFGITRKPGHLRAFMKAILWNIKTNKTANTYNS
jgi:hypothetical protein